MTAFSTYLLILHVTSYAASRPLDSQTPLSFINSAPPASLPVSNPTKSFWIDTPGANLLAKEGSTGALTGDADVCIIGSGMTGVSAAYHLSNAIAKSGSNLQVKAVVLEARDFCSGATGRNGGHLTPYSFFGYLDYESQFGTEHALKALRLENRTATEMVNVIENEGLAGAVDLVKGGHVSLISSEKELLKLRAHYDAAREGGLDVSGVEWLNKEEVEKTYGASYPGVRFPAYNFWPLKFVTQVYLLAKSKTPRFLLKLHTHTPVTSVEPISSSSGSRKWRANTPRGAVQCSYVLHATNGYASHLLPHMRGSAGIIPTRGQVVAVRTISAVPDRWRVSWGGLDHYWFLRPVNGSDSDENERALTILGGGRGVGGLEEDNTDDSTLNTEVGKDLRAFLPHVFPAMFKEEQGPEMEWTGIMGFTSMKVPFVGPVLDTAQSNERLYDGQYISAGYSGHGMPQAFSCAEAVAGMISSEILGQNSSLPDWLPTRYFTRHRNPEVFPVSVNGS